MSASRQILTGIEHGDAIAAEQLLPFVYEELRRLAARRLALEKPGQTLSSTALVHEAYLRLGGGRKFANSRYFFAAAAEAMRRILVENARRKKRKKRGGECHRVDLELDGFAGQITNERLLALDEALERFAQREPAKAELVRLHWFAGLSLVAAAKVLDISPPTADRWWAYGRAWLRAEVSGDNSASP